MERSKKRHFSFLLVCESAALVGGVICVLPMFGVDTWVGELAASWRPHIAAGVLVFAVAALVERRRLIAGLLVAVAVTLGADVIWSGLVSAQAEAGTQETAAGEVTRVMFSNVLIHNRSLADLIVWIDEKQPDVVVLTEITPTHVLEITEAMADYPYQVLEPRPHAFGMVIYSRLPIAGHPFATLTRDSLSDGGPVTLVADIETPLGLLQVAGMHRFPPAAKRSWELRAEQLDAAVDIWARSMAPWSSSATSTSKPHG
ncbi:MAG: endonuclease/exonuclease/phosphatase family protein, partial [Rhodospirillaceae bacterium]|nr:endonuclease/exonuclease/phosphatase family protein [Rhodospirillaceae bacterium]